VLLNNRRAGPAGVRGSVSSFDFNVLPLTMIDRVEILKDGASSIYGSMRSRAWSISLHVSRMAWS
jgi:iron complex outermembrane recepter protein